MAWSDDQKKRTFQCWSDMKQRCYNPKTANYKNYGGRGISVCSRWLESFENFQHDMGLRPDGMTIDRIDVNGHYEPANCRWASKKDQQSNRRNNRLITHDGQTLTARQWSKHLGISEATISFRVLRGYPTEMVLSKQKFLHGSKKATAAMEASK